MSYCELGPTFNLKNEMEPTQTSKTTSHDSIDKYTFDSINYIFTKT